MSTPSSLKAIESSFSASLEQGLVAGRVTIDFLQPGFKCEGHFRELLTINGEEKASPNFPAKTTRHYSSEAEFRQAFRDRFVDDATAQTLLSNAQDDPSLLIDIVALLMFSLYQEDLLLQQEGEP